MVSIRDGLYILIRQITMGTIFHISHITSIDKQYLIVPYCSSSPQKPHTSRYTCVVEQLLWQC